MCLFLSGCGATCLRTPASSNDKKSIKSNVAIVATTQKKIVSDPDVCAHNASDGLLKWALVSAEASHVRKNMQPVLKNLKGFDVTKVFQNSLHNKLKQMKWLNIKEIFIRHDLEVDNYRNSFAKMKENSMLFTTFNYSVNFKVTAVKMESYVTLYKKDAKDRLKITPIYDNDFKYIYYLPRKVTTRTEAVALWSKDHGKLIKHALATGTQHIAMQIVKDMNNPKTNLYQSMQSKKTISFKDGYRNEKKDGKLIEKYGDFYVIRMDDDSAYIFNKNTLWKKRPRGIFGIVS
jgi:hypothetical protein